MTYRDDRDALKDRISFLEGQLARQAADSGANSAHKQLEAEVAELKEGLLVEQANRLLVESKLRSLETEALESEYRALVEQVKLSDQSSSAESTSGPERPSAMVAIAIALALGSIPFLGMCGGR